MTRLSRRARTGCLLASVLRAASPRDFWLARDRTRLGRADFSIHKTRGLVMGGDNDIGYDANDQQERGGRGRAGDVQHRTARDAARRRLARGVVERVDQRRAVVHGTQHTTDGVVSQK